MASITASATPKKPCEVWPKNINFVWAYWAWKKPPEINLVLPTNSNDAKAPVSAKKNHWNMPAD
jgi:hypothetical protein